MLDIKVRNGLPYPVVGVGASADDAGALLEYFAGRPFDSGMIYIVTQPPSADGNTQICVTAESLAQHTQMPVSMMTDGMSLEPNHIYVMPPLRREPDAARQRLRAVAP